LDLVVLIALAVSPAQARYRHHLNNYSTAQPRYESCNCYFGYIGNGPGECTPVVSCFSEGGRCKATCPPQLGYSKPKISPVEVVVPANDHPANDRPANDRPANDH
jgi:hypothetical protein